MGGRRHRLLVCKSNLLLPEQPSFYKNFLILPLGYTSHSMILFMMLHVYFYLVSISQYIYLLNKGKHSNVGILTCFS